ncbi:hypothetical protein SCUCBS95973_002398 [Sporothrix curviconia]|uniref:Protein HRI1 n=1 Tax=Sporothrix curviconia TaxID=1260050 RepID=A0ABP0B6G5_9PEZI
MARLSTRISVRWGDEPASEPTTTLVMGVGGYFMDLRVNKSDKTVDWAFAGRRETVSETPLHCRWHHIIDSRNAFAPDEGSFVALPNGDSLETGSMPCPERGGAVTPYEEVWRTLSTGRERGWILQRDDGDDAEATVTAAATAKTTAFLGRVGSEFFAMVQTRGGGPLSVQREALETVDGGKQNWVVKFRDGEAPLPSLAAAGLLAFPGEASWTEGDEVDIQGALYTVRALEPGT